MFERKTYHVITIDIKQTIKVNWPSPATVPLYLLKNCYQGEGCLYSDSVTLQIFILSMLLCCLSLSVLYHNPIVADLVWHLRYKEMKTVSVPKLCINTMSVAITLKFWYLCRVATSKKYFLFFQSSRNLITPSLKHLTLLTSGMLCVC